MAKSSSLASTAGRERQRHQRTAPPQSSTSPPRPARRKRNGAAPQALRDDEGLDLLGGAGLLRRSQLPPEKQVNGGANPKSWIWPEQTRDSPPKRRHLAYYSTRQLLNLPLRTPAPPRRRSRPASPAGTTVDRAGTLELSLGYCSEGGGCRGRSCTVAAGEATARTAERGGH
jgi:hypothetical protein